MKFKKECFANGVMGFNILRIENVIDFSLNA